MAGSERPPELPPERPPELPPERSRLIRTRRGRLIGGVCSGLGAHFGVDPILLRIAFVGLAIFGLYTVIDFNRLRRAGREEAIPLAAAIFLDIFNVFLLFLRLFSSSR